MFQNKSTPFEDDIEKATSENNLSEDWSQIMLICDNAVNYQDGSKFCLKAIMKRLHHSVPRVVMQALVLLDSCVKNCDKRFLLQVASSEFTTEVRKLLGKMHPSCATKLKELLQKWSMEEFKDDPELCIIPALYYKLKSEGVEFPSLEKEKKIAAPICNDPNAVSSQEEENDIIRAIEISLKDTGKYSAPIEEATSRLSLSQPQEKSRREPFKVLALYDFEAVEENELTLKAGEVILVTDNSDSNWWKGSNQLSEGLFPSNFVSEDDYLKSLEPKIEASSTSEVEDTSNDIVTVNEEKIDQVLNWLNDVDPTEELIDPENMLKLEKECYKMAPQIEENLHSIDNRLAMLDATNEKIMAAFDLFHDLSTVNNQWATLPLNMKSYTSPMQMPYTQHAFPPSMSTSESKMPSQNAILSQPSVSSNIPPEVNNQQNMKAINATQNQTTNLPASIQTVADNSVVSQTTGTTTAATNPSVSQVIHPASMMNPYATGIMGGIFVPPGIPYPFPPPNPQQGYMPFPGPSQAYLGMPYAVPPMGPHVPYPYYYVNSPQPPVLLQSNNSEDPSVSQSQDVTSNTSTSASNGLNMTSLPPVSNPSYFNDLQQMTPVDSTSVLTPSSTKQELLQTSTTHASGDGQVSTNSSSGESS
ncbi:signal transducing adapter molecule 2 isoform X1 [Parasteatoda tepidariorum]|uniref:Signal transducing adapter molecule 1 n=2 Tax=Parasteatoda tepidariorum TaxID=114398 RepID=A0A2L2YAH1_PARTP|nr:signal transducing adapter molecule 2 isoform X1 [Parasteatoda tepidariorum]